MTGTEHNWFRRKIGFWFAPSSRSLGREEWIKIRRVSRWGNKQRHRRVVMLLWIGLLTLDASIAVDVARHGPTLAIYPTLALFGFALWAFRRMAIGLAQPALEDRAVMQYGVELDALNEDERGELFNQHLRDSIRGRASKDERESELRLSAEGAAYRLLRPGLMIAVGAYWAACLLGPFAPVRETLAISAIVFTWFALAVLVLPVMIRMWTEPDEVGEPRVVNHEGSSHIAQQ